VPSPRSEPLVLLPLAPLQRDRRAEIVIPDPAKQPPKADNASTCPSKNASCAGRGSPGARPSPTPTSHHEHPALRGRPVQPTPHLPEVHLGLPARLISCGTVSSGSPWPAPGGAHHITAHPSTAPPSPVLIGPCDAAWVAPSDQPPRSRRSPPFTSQQRPDPVTSALAGPPKPTPGAPPAGAHDTCEPGPGCSSRGSRLSPA
jgi:hypothetical protein